MKFFEILTQYDITMEDGSSDFGSDSFIMTEDEYNDELLTKITESEYGEGMKVRSIEVREMTPDEFSKASQVRIIDHIILNIYRESLNLLDNITVREFVKLRNDPSYKALALKQFEDKYSIYRMLKHDLDFTKVTVADLYNKIEKIYSARLTDEYLEVYKECICD